MCSSSAGWKFCDTLRRLLVLNDLFCSSTSNFTTESARCGDKRHTWGKETKVVKLNHVNITPQMEWSICGLLDDIEWIQYFFVSRCIRIHSWICDAEKLFYCAKMHLGIVCIVHHRYPPSSLNPDSTSKSCVRCPHPRCFESEWIRWKIDKEYLQAWCSETLLCIRRSIIYVIFD